MAMRRFGERAKDIELEHVMQVPERLLFGNDLDVELFRVRDQFLHLVLRHHTAGRRHERMRLVLKRVLVVGRVHVQLESRKVADLHLLVVERRQGTAGEIVLHAAPAHGRPIANGASVNEGFRAVSAHELLDGLCAVEQAGGRCSENDGLIFIDDNGVAFGALLVAEYDADGIEDGLRGRRVGADQRDVVRAWRYGRRDRRANAARGERAGEIVGCKSVVTVRAGGHGDGPRDGNV